MINVKQGFFYFSIFNVLYIEKQTKITELHGLQRYIIQHWIIVCYLHINLSSADAGCLNRTEKLLHDCRTFGPRTHTNKLLENKKLEENWNLVQVTTAILWLLGVRKISLRLSLLGLQGLPCWIMQTLKTWKNNSSICVFKLKWKKFCCKQIYVQVKHQSFLNLKEHSLLL